MVKKLISKPTRREGISRAETVYAALLNRLRSGSYIRGERIREEDVALSLEVSRTPVREALARLESHGLLTTTARGLTVSVLNRSQIIELYALRGVLEGAAARFAAQHASPGDIELLRSLNVAFRDAKGDPARQARLNRELHETIYEAAHNGYLIRSLQDLHDFLALLPTTTFSVKGRDGLAATEHELIISAIESHEPDAAEAAAREHIRMAQMTRLTLTLDLRS